MSKLVRWPKKVAPTEAEILAYFSADGLSPHNWCNSPNYEYPVHRHPYTKVLYCLKGTIDFQIHPDGKIFDLNPGDKLVVDAKAGHSAVVGPFGVTCIEAPKY